MVQGGYRPPPGPFIGGRQPYEPLKYVPQQTDASAPTPTTEALLYSIIEQWPQPNWPAQRARFTPQQTDASAPIPRSTAWLYGIRQQWPEPSWPAQRAPRTPQQTDSQPTPFIQQRQDLLWPQPSWPTQTTRKVVQDGTPVVTVDQPFVRQRIDWPQLTWPAQRAPTFAALAPFDKTPFVQQRIDLLWPPITWRFQRGATIASTTASVDAPPPRVRFNFNVMWPAPTWPAQRAPFSATTPSVDPPPPTTLLRQLYNIITQWPQPKQLWPTPPVTPPPTPETPVIPVVPFVGGGLGSGDPGFGWVLPRQEFNEALRQRRLARKHAAKRRENELRKKLLLAVIKAMGLLDDEESN